ncbi:MAG TPA: DNA repair protein RecO [Nitrospiria bacterium]|jgi:DNA repair protein RecO (recombination protein O)
MSLIRTEGIVLRNKTLGESDRLVHLFTLTHGKLKGVAKGARRPKNRFGSALEPITHASLFLFERRTGGLFQIQEAEIIRSFQALREDLNTIFYASHFLRWIEAFLPEGESRPTCFHLLREFLSLLGEVKDVESLARCFEIKVLDLSGFRPRLDVCGDCGKTLERKKIYFSFLEGRGLCNNCGSQENRFHSFLSPGTVASVHQILTLYPNKVSRLHLNVLMKKELGKMTRDYAKHLLGKEIGTEQMLCHSFG